MKTKKYRKIGIIFLIIIIMQIATFACFFVPYAHKRFLYQALESGNKAEAQRVYKMIYLLPKKTLKEDIQNFETAKVNEFVDGKVSYNELYKTLETVESLEGYRNQTASYFQLANAVQLTKLLDEAGKVYIEEGEAASKYNQLWMDFNKAYGAVDSKYSKSVQESYKEAINNAMINHLNNEFAKFERDETSLEDIHSLVAVAVKFYPAELEASEYAQKMQGEIDVLDGYKAVYAKAKKAVDDQDYFTAVAIVRKALQAYGGQSNFVSFAPEFENLEKVCNEDGVKKYLDDAAKLAESKDIKGARELVAKVQKAFGDQVDVSNVTNVINKGWKDAYTSYMEKWEENLTADMAAGVDVALYKSANRQLSDATPDSIVLEDLNDDGIPELIFSSSSVKYVVTYTGEGTVFAGMFEFYGLTGDKHIIIQNLSEIGDMTAEIALKEGKFETVTIANSGSAEVEKDGKKETAMETRVNGAVVDEATYESLKATLEANGTGKFADGVKIEDAKTYIESYK